VTEPSQKAASSESPAPRGYFGRALDDVVALAPAASEIGRRGAVAAVVVTLGLALVACAIGGACFAVANWLSGSSSSINVTRGLILFCFAPLLLLAFAMVQAGPLAAFGLAARTDGAVPIGDAFLRALRRAPWLALVDFVLFAILIPVMITAGCAGQLLFSAGGALSSAIVVVIQAFFVLPMVGVVSSPDGGWPGIQEAGRLRRGRYALLLVAALVPHLIQMIARPSDVGVKAAQDFGADLALVQFLVAAAGWVASFFVGALLAAAAWKVVSRPRSSLPLAPSERG
jgi:hypothetical protein